MIELCIVSIAGAFGLIGFFVPAVLLHLSGFELVGDLYGMLIKQQSPGPMAKSINF